MAQAITDRYAVIQQRWPAMALVFEPPDRTSPSVTNTYQTTHASLFMNPRFLLRRLVSYRAENPYEVAGRTSAQSLSGKAISMTVAVSSRSQPENQEGDDVIARILRRAVREDLPSMAKAGSARRTSVQAANVAYQEPAVSRFAPSLKRTYRRAAPAKEEAFAIPAAAQAQRESSSATGGRDVGAAMPSHPPIDIARITDQVLHALDRRIVTQRERMGVH
jgi:hypothetical protein